MRHEKILAIILGFGLLGGCASNQTPQQGQAPRALTPAKTAPVEASKPTMAPKGKKIALLVPLSGAQSELGKSLLKASQMAIFDGGATDITLMPIDTRGTPEGASLAAQKALDQNAQMILGPVFSKEVGAVKSIAASRQIPVISFTTDMAVLGGGAYSLGFMPAQQVERILNFAASQGMDTIITITPTTDYGRIVDQTVQGVVQKGQIKTAGSFHYGPQDLTLGSPALITLTGQIKDAHAKGAKAIFFPEAGVPLETLSQALAGAGLSQMKILGTGQWDGPQVSTIPTLQGGLFAAPDPGARTRFESKFRASFQQVPPRIASLAYDGTALAISLAPKGYEVSSLTSSQGFMGSDGLFRLKGDGSSERGLAVLEVGQGGVRVINGAPARF